MEINYRDYLHESSDNAYFSYLSVYKPNDLRKPDKYVFSYYIGYEMKTIEKQARCFSNEVLRNSVLAHIVHKNVAGPPKVKEEVVKKLYIYSYLKTFNMCVLLQESGGDYTGNPSANSTVLKGHSELYKIFYDSYLLFANFGNTSILNTCMLKEIAIKSEDITKFRNDDVYQQYNESKNRSFFLNTDLERLLNAFKVYGSDHIAIDEFSSMYRIDPRRHPLGNMCLFSVADSELISNSNRKSEFVHDEDVCPNDLEVMSVTSTLAITDTNSKFWNIANRIYIDKCDKKFDRCYFSPYAYIKYSSIDETSIYAQVQAISGINCGDQFTTFGAHTSPSSAEPDFGGPSPNGNNPHRGKGPNGDDLGGNNKRGHNKPTPKKGPSNKKSSNNVADAVAFLGNVAKAGGKTAFTAMGHMLEDPNVRNMVTEIIIKKGQNKALEPAVPLKIQRVSTTVGNDYLPLKRQVDTEEISYKQ